MVVPDSVARRIGRLLADSQLAAAVDAVNHVELAQARERMRERRRQLADDEADVPPSSGPSPIAAVPPHLTARTEGEESWEEEEEEEPPLAWTVDH